MSLYEKLFGRIMMAPAGDDGDAGGAPDRGDDFVGTEPPPDDAPVETDVEDDAEKALGKEDDKGEEQPRDAGGKFAKKDRGETSIPRARFDEAVRRERERAEAAERRLQEFEQQRQQISRTADIDKLETQVKDLRSQERKALVAGDDDKAAELSEQADRLNRQIAIEQSRDMSAAMKEQAREEIRMELTIDRLTAEYPQLDTASDDFDQELTDDVLDKQRGYIERDRMSPSKALLKAAQYVMARFRPAAAEDVEGKNGLNAAERGGDRKQAAVKKNIDAASRQPASTKRAGADSDKFGQTGAVPAATDMTFEEFSALPDSTKAKMRGDFV